MKYAKIMLLASSLLSGLVLSGLTLAADPKGEAKLTNMPKLGLVSGKAVSIRADSQVAPEPSIDHLAYLEADLEDNPDASRCKISRIF